MTESILETVSPDMDIDYDLQRKEQQIQNLLDDFDFFVEHLTDEYQAGNYVEELEDGKRIYYYHNIAESDKTYSDERRALEALFDHKRYVESAERTEDRQLPF